jgi:hypothetical protein
LLLQPHEDAGSVQATTVGQNHRALAGHVWREVRKNVSDQSWPAANSYPFPTQGGGQAQHASTPGLGQPYLLDELPLGSEEQCVHLSEPLTLHTLHTSHIPRWGLGMLTAVWGQGRGGVGSPCLLEQALEAESGPRPLAKGCGWGLGSGS